MTERGGKNKQQKTLKKYNYVSRLQNILNDYVFLALILMLTVFGMHFYSGCLKSNLCRTVQIVDLRVYSWCYFFIFRSKKFPCLHFLSVPTRVSSCV